ncbi:MAG TPA: hypothetical protein DHV26_01285 [Cytophagales bacterium]|nr:hypothetical protein [Cytophagales bacterium]HRG08493.1 hypothetical protein [Cyclobacteriaceae bacterium]
MRLLSTRGWEEIEWAAENEFIADNDSYFQFKLRFKTKFWDRKDLLRANVTEPIDDTSFEFSQVSISQRDLNPWLEFLDSLTKKNLSDLRIGTEKEFKLSDKEGEKLKLTIADSTQNPGYKIKVDFKRGKTNLTFEMETDITCLTNYYATFIELTK